MFEAFLFDFKQAIGRSKGKLNVGQWVCILFVFACALGLLFGVFTSRLFVVILSFLILLIVIVFMQLLVLRTVNSNENIHTHGESEETRSTVDENTNPERTREQNDDSKFAQLNWYKKYRVTIVNDMVKKEVTGLEQDKCIELLIEECDKKLKTARPSEILKKRLALLVVPVSTVLTTVTTAWLKNLEVIEKTAKASGENAERLTTIMDSVASIVVSDGAMFSLFLILCTYLIVFYVFIVFVVWPICTTLIDRDWILTNELRDTLRFIQICEQPEE